MCYGQAKSPGLLVYIGEERGRKRGTLLGSEGKDSVEDVIPYFAGDTEAELKVCHQRPSYS